MDSWFPVVSAAQQAALICISHELTSFLSHFTLFITMAAGGDRMTVILCPNVEQGSILPPTGGEVTNFAGTLDFLWVIIVFHMFGAPGP